MKLTREEWLEVVKIAGSVVTSTVQFHDGQPVYADHNLFLFASQVLKEQFGRIIHVPSPNQSDAVSVSD